MPDHPHDRHGKDDDRAVGGVGATPSGLGWGALARGAVLSRYVVVEQIGFGGMGRVYAAYDPDLDRKVAVKILRDDGEAGDTGRDRLLREAQAMARLSHPNVVAVHDVGTVGDAVFVAMELLPGRTLREWLNDGRADPPSIRTVLRVFVEAGRGLAAAHEAGLVHRDFKPENVMVLDDGRVKVLDFGLVRPAGFAIGIDGGAAAAGTPMRAEPPAGARLDTPLTVPGTIVGTPGYMAPEQMIGDPSNPATDQFAFCVALWEALFGERPFAGLTLPAQLLEIEAGRLREVPPESKVPRHVVQALQRGLCPRPEDRFPSMVGLLAELERDPGRTLRRRLLLSAAAVALLATTAALWLLWSRPPNPCGGAADQLIGIWDPPTKRAIHDALTATGRSYAGGVWTRLENHLDDYASHWAAQYTEACEATFVRGQQSEQLLDLRMFCLQDRLGELRALTDLLRQADDTILERAERAGGNLSDLSGCADVERLRERVPLPSGAQRRRLEELTPRLASAEALLEARKYGEGLAIAEPLAAAANELGYAPFTAEALLVLGRLEAGAGRYQDGGATLRESLWSAEEGRHDEVAVRAAIALVALEGNSQARFERGQEWARQARALLGRLGGDPSLEAELDEQVGAMLRYRGRWDEAVASYRAALAIWERLYGADDPRAAAALRGLAATLRFQGRYDEAIEDLERALDLERGALGGDHPEVAATLDVLANVYRDEGLFDRARELQVEALGIAERALGPDHPQMARYHSDLGALLESGGRYTEALESNRRALEIRERSLPPEHPDLGISLNNLAVTLLGLGRPAEALPYHERALAIFEAALGPDHLWVAHPLWGLGSDLLELGRPAEAIPSLERGLAVREAREVNLGERAEMRIALARALWESGTDRDRARRLMVEAASELRSVQGRQTELDAVDLWLRQHGRDANADR